MRKILSETQQYISIREAAELLDISVDTLRRWEKEGKISAKRQGGKRFFLRGAIERLLIDQPLTISQTAERLGLSQSTLRRLETKGLLKPIRDKNGERLYPSQTVQKFLNSEYFLSQKAIEHAILTAGEKPTLHKKQTTKQVLPELLEESKKAIVKHKVLATLEEENRKKINYLSHTSGIFFQSIFLFLGTALLGVVLSTLGFLFFPKQTAELFGYVYVGKESSSLKVLGAKTPKNNALLAAVLRPLGDISLEVVRQVDPSLAEKIVKEEPSQQRVMVTEDAKTILGKVPGKKSGDLVVFAENGLIKGLRIEGSQLAHGAVNLASSVISGVLSLGAGGTNSILSPSAGGVLYSNSTGLLLTSIGSAGQVLLSNGTDAPSFGTLSVSYGGTGADLSGTTSGSFIYKTASGLSGSGALTGIVQGNGSAVPTAILGTKNYLTKWSSSAPYLTTTSSLYDNGNVGIGTTSPGSALEVVGSIYANTGQVRLGNFSSAPTAIGSGALYYDTVNNKVYYYNGSSWQEVGSGSGSSVFSLLNGLIIPGNTTADFAVGATSTGSAKFAIINVTSGTPTATIAGNITLDSTGSLQTTKNQLLTLGGGSTGNILFSPLNGSGFVGINTSTPTQALDVTGSIRVSSSFIAGSSTGTTVSSAACVTAVGGIVTGSASCPTASNWTITNGTIAPNNTTLDLLLGGVASSSAKFAVLNIAAGTPTASVSAGTTGGAYLTATGNLQTTAAQALTIGGSTTGNIYLNPRNGTSGGAIVPVVTNATDLGNGTNLFRDLWLQRTLQFQAAGSTVTSERTNVSYSTSANVVVSSGYTDQRFWKLNIPPMSVNAGQTVTNASTFWIEGAPSNAGSGSITNSYALFVAGGTTRLDGNVGIGAVAPAARLDVRYSSGTIPVASVSGVTSNASLVVDNSGVGDVFAASTAGLTRFVIKNDGNVGIGLTNPSQRLDVIGNIRAAVGYVAGASTGVSSSNACVTAVGGIVTAVAAGCGTTSPFQEIALQGIIIQNNTTEDLLLGGVATSSAKFAVLNVNSGTPIASVSAGTSGATYLTASGTLQTTANQTLQIGGSTTGNIVFNRGTDAALQITAGGAILATGNTTTGITPISGAGTRMMWIPAKSAFRVGYVDGTQWDNSNIGSYSFATGYGTTASGIGAAVFGESTVVSGDDSVAFGFLTTTSGTTSLTCCRYATTSVANAITLGQGVDNANRLINNTASSLMIGFNSTVPTLFVGGASGAGTYGNVGIGTTSIEGMFKVEGKKIGKALATFNETGDQAIFTASASGTTKFVINNNGNVGIGTTTPASAFELGSGQIFVPDGSATAPSISFSSDPDTGIYHHTTTNNLSFATSGSEQLRITATGKFLLATAGDAAGPTFTLRSDSDTGFFWPAANNFAISTGGVEAIRFDSNGNVGIGTSTPVGLLHVTGAKIGKALATFNETGDQAIFTASASGTTKLVINNSGNLGLNTSAPSYRLHIVGASSGGSNNEGILLENTNATPGESVVGFKNVQTGSNQWFTGLNEGTGYSIAYGSAFNSSNTGLHLTNGRLVGIGTISPAGKLHITNSGAASVGKAELTVDQYENQAIFTASASGTTKFVIDNAGNVGIGTTDTATSPLAISNLPTGGTTALQVDASGNVFKAASSIRYKDNIRDFTTDFEKILEVDPKKYTYKSNGTLDIGYLAEDFDAKGLKDLVVYDKEGRPDALKYDKISLYLVEILKKQQKSLATLLSDRQSQASVAGILSVGLSTEPAKVITQTVAADTITSFKSSEIVLQLLQDGSFIIKDETGKPAVTIDSKGNAFFAGNVHLQGLNVTGTLTVDTLKANKIDGLELLTADITKQEGRLTDLVSLVASSSGSRQAVLSDSTNASATPLAVRDTLPLSGLIVDGQATVSGSLRVKGNGLVEGMLRVVDTLMTQNLIVTKLATFFDTVIFKKDVQFDGHVNVANDTAGTLVLQKDADSVAITFEKEYTKTPIINLTPSFTDSETATVSAGETAVLNGELHYVVTKATKKGFSIRLNKPAPEDIHFSWVALGTKEQNHKTATGGDSPQDTRGGE